MSKAVLVIMDGFGIAPPSDGNAISRAATPRLDAIFAENPYTTLSASGMSVGLPEGQMGNSEVGHTNIGAGRVVFQDLPRISNAIKDGSFFENPAYVEAMDNAKRSGKALHILGLLSDGGVHSHIDHIFAALDMAKRRGLERVYVHCFLDGRDVPPTSGSGYVSRLCEKCAELGNAKVADLQGRFYAMDRDKRWDRVELAYNAMVCGEGEFCGSPVEAVEKSYAQGVTDEFVKPVVCCNEGRIESGDSVIFMNFRPDRAREITWALTLPDFDGFERKKTAYPLSYVCTARYDETLTLPVAFPPEDICDTLGETVAAKGLKQFRVAETEKYAHVTFFFNGGVEKPEKGEERCLVPSPKQFPTYDLIPEMSAAAVCDKCVEAIKSDEYALIVCNFANCDMVGHTGVMDAAVKAVETVDACMGRIYDAVRSMPDTVLLITADHGNADCMVGADGKVNTAHTTNPVPFAVCRKGLALQSGGKLADIAPTILEIMDIQKPCAMSGRSLIK